jgi:dTDP-4-dehydrorhamnose 3,5-epimerase
VKVIESKLAGVLVLEPEPVVDQRGFFARSWDADALVARGLEASACQASISWNAVRGTLRGLHYQAEPFAEAKTVTCVSGAIWDVAIDLRPGSPTRYEWIGVELDATTRASLYVPPGCAHGFVTLSDGAEVRYLMSATYHPEADVGIRWDDPTLAIEWPEKVVRISERDAALPLLVPEA